MKSEETKFQKETETVIGNISDHNISKIHQEKQTDFINNINYIHDVTDNMINENQGNLTKGLTNNLHKIANHMENSISEINIQSHENSIIDHLIDNQIKTTNNYNYMNLERSTENLLKILKGHEISNSQITQVKNKVLEKIEDTNMVKKSHTFSKEYDSELLSDKKSLTKPKIIYRKNMLQKKNSRKIIGRNKLDTLIKGERKERMSLFSSQNRTHKHLNNPIKDILPKKVSNSKLVNNTKYEFNINISVSPNPKHIQNNQCNFSNISNVDEDDQLNPFKSFENKDNNSNINKDQIQPDSVKNMVDHIFNNFGSMSLANKNKHFATTIQKKEFKIEEFDIDKNFWNNKSMDK